MKILKKHGKKVSVMLLAIALMISPMLPIVKAADNDTCEKRLHYYFLLAEEAYIDHFKTEGSKVQRTYSGEFPEYFGLTEDDVNKDKITLQSGYSWIDDGEAITSVDFNTKAVATNGQTGNTKGFQSKFYNVELPDGYELSSSTPTLSYWNSDDWKRYADMYENLVKVYGEATSGTIYAKQNETVTSDADDIYLIHYVWKNGTGQEGDTEWKDSDTTHALKTMFEDFASWPKDVSSIDVKTNILQQVADASIDVTKKTGTSVSITTNEGLNALGKDNSTIITMDAIRNIKGISRPTKFYGWMDKVGNDLSGKGFNEDNKYWFFFPMTATYTFTASGDVCGAGNNVIDTSESSTNNPGTGIVSYAIIGTLLVGAASAYIYARKNNKFNKV